MYQQNLLKQDVEENGEGNADNDGDVVEEDDEDGQLTTRQAAGQLLYPVRSLMNSLPSMKSRTVEINCVQG